MKIAIITKHLNYHGGVEIYNSYLMEVLTNNYGEVEILVPKSSNSNILYKKFKWLSEVFYLRGGLPKDIANYDLVICNGEYGWGINHPKCICFFHGTYYGYKKFLRGKLKFRSYVRLLLLSYIQKSASKNKYIIAVSNLTKGLLAEQKIQTDAVINGCIGKIQSVKNLITSHNRKLLFVGRYDYFGKGFDILEQISSAGYTIDCVTDQNPGAKLNWLRIRSHKDILELYSKYLILVFPSRYEGSPLVPLEAMAAGLPVVINDIGYYEELKANVPEFFVKNNSIEKFIAAISQIESNYEYYSKKAFDYVKIHHNFSIFEQNVIRMIDQVLSNNQNE